MERKLYLCLALMVILVAGLGFAHSVQAKKSGCNDGTCEVPKAKAEVPNLSSEENRVLSREKEALWKAINWQTSASAAAAAAKEQNKPLLVVLSVGQRGKATATDT
jgi:hypothetical protein